MPSSWSTRADRRNERAGADRFDGPAELPGHQDGTTQRQTINTSVFIQIVVTAFGKLCRFLEL